MANKISLLRGCCLFASVRDGVSPVDFDFETTAVTELWAHSQLMCQLWPNFPATGGEVDVALAHHDIYVN